MSPPAIRYPLPTFVMLVIVGLLAWKGEALTRSFRRTVASRLAEAVAGPSPPASSSAQKLVAPLSRRILLLHDGTRVSRLPDGQELEPIRLRQFMDVFDVWPLKGATTHYRVGNRNPIGWIRAEDALEWSTRLAVRLKIPTAGRPPVSRPVLEWSEGRIRIATWDEWHPWQVVATADQFDDSLYENAVWGVWISREELLALIGRLGRAKTSEAAEEYRLRAIVGQIALGREWSAEEIAAIRDFLPSECVKPSDRPLAKSLELLAIRNEQWEFEASWSGLSFGFLPLSELP